MSVPPGEGAQLAFLANIQRILAEGQFTATYKFGLLLALVEIAIERGDDSGSALPVRIDCLAEKFIELYWRHTRPFQGAVLRQNRRDNVSILAPIMVLQGRASSLAEARRLAEWPRIVKRVGAIVRKMPLYRLQLLRGNQRYCFLYDEREENDAIVLKPGAAFCLRKFSGLIGTLCREAWLREVRGNPHNAYAVGETQSLEAFLFGDDRVPLGRVREILLPIQQGRCFYCGKSMGATVHVDHFVPWALYPSNLGHNLVLADGPCNGDKSDLLADVAHLRRWQQRNEANGTAISDAFRATGLVADLDASFGIARWAYQHARAAGSIVWTGRGSTRPLPKDSVLSL